jgi:hypothetical protein
LCIREGAGVRRSVLDFAHHLAERARGDAG